MGTTGSSAAGSRDFHPYAVGTEVPTRMLNDDYLELGGAGGAVVGTVGGDAFWVEGEIQFEFISSDLARTSKAFLLPIWVRDFVTTDWQ